jgi:hypothetical protein
MPSNKVSKPTPYPSARRMTREATTAPETHTVNSDETRAEMEAESERDVMESGGGQEEVGRRGDGKDLVDLEAELEREMMECDDEGVEPRRGEESVDPLFDGPLDCNDEVDSLFGDPLDSEPE